MSGVLKGKRNACEGCYRSRVKCEYKDEEKKRCARCIRQNRECIPRLVARGKGNVQRFSELDLNAYRSAAVFDDLPHLTLNYNAANSLVKTYKSLGFSSPPTALRWAINSLYLLAVCEKSVSLLHTSTTLAVSTGTPIDVAVLNEKHCPVTEEQKQIVERQVYERFLENNHTGACFIIRLDVGDRALVSNEMFSTFFDSANSVVSKLAKAPHFKLWRNYIVEPASADAFTAKMVQTWLKSGEPVGDPPRVTWECMSDERVQIMDNSGNVYSCTLFESGVFMQDGFVSFLIFEFKDMEGVSEGAKKRLEAFKADVGLRKVHSVPSFSRIDSVVSLLLQPISSMNELFGIESNDNNDNNQTLPLIPDPTIPPPPTSNIPQQQPHQPVYGQPQQLMQQNIVGVPQHFESTSSTSTSGSDKKLVKANSSTNSLLAWNDALVPLDSPEFWGNMDKVIEGLGGEQVVQQWRH